MLGVPRLMLAKPSPSILFRVVLAGWYNVSLVTITSMVSFLLVTPILANRMFSGFDSPVASSKKSGPVLPRLE